MSPKAYAELRTKQKQEAADEQKRIDDVQKKRTREEKLLYDNICFALKDYDLERIDGYLIRIDKHPEKYQVHFLVDGNHYLTFCPTRHYSGCGCNGPCEHEPNTWVTLNVRQHSKKGGDKDIYFPCSMEQLLNANEFAIQLSKVMDTYRY
jgi:hypothetical protein